MPVVTRQMKRNAALMTATPYKKHNTKHTSFAELALWVVCNCIVAVTLICRFILESLYCPLIILHFILVGAFILICVLFAAVACVAPGVCILLALHYVFAGN